MANKHSGGAHIRRYLHHTPTFDATVYIDPCALVIGDVSLGADTSVWPFAVIRGDMHRISIGERSSIQDGSVLHITHAGPFNTEGFPLTIGDDVTVGHNVCLHGCTIGNRVLVGIGTTVLDGAVVEDEVVIGAGTLVPPGKRLESGFLYMGSPCKQIRPLKDKEREFFRYSAGNYVALKNHYLDNTPSAAADKGANHD
jgi:carbonic anhydrase/acetyltransferase-like protein (isoleucine patch superfamily)